MNKTIDLNVRVLKDNADENLKLYQKTKDRYYMGQWKAYFRIWKRVQKGAISEIYGLQDAKAIYRNN